MFTGLTNQVSTWMGKKAEDAGTELPPEEKIPVTAEGEELDRKDRYQFNLYYFIVERHNLI